MDSPSSHKTSSTTIPIVLSVILSVAIVLLLTLLMVFCLRRQKQGSESTSHIAIRSKFKVSNKLSSSGQGDASVTVEKEQSTNNNLSANTRLGHLRHHSAMLIGGLEHDCTEYWSYLQEFLLSSKVAQSDVLVYFFSNPPEDNSSKARSLFDIWVREYDFTLQQLYEVLNKSDGPPLKAVAAIEILMKKNLDRDSVQSQHDQQEGLEVKQRSDSDRPLICRTTPIIHVPRERADHSKLEIGRRNLEEESDIPIMQAESQSPAPPWPSRRLQATVTDV